MNLPNISDFAWLVTAVAIFFSFHRVVSGGQFLRDWINPHKQRTLILAFGFFSIAVGLLRYETHSFDPAQWLRLLSNLVNDQRTTSQVFSAAFFLALGLCLLACVLICQIALPRDPSTFTAKTSRAKAVRYYTQLRGGMDYTVLLRIDKQTNKILEKHENYYRNQIHHTITELPGQPDLAIQIERWNQLALHFHANFQQWESHILPAGQGPLRKILFDVRQGGILARYVQSREAPGDYWLLFGATLHEREVENGRLEEHFDLLLRALRNIDKHLFKD